MTAAALHSLAPHVSFLHEHRRTRRRQRTRSRARLRAIARPRSASLLPVGLAVAWEIAVRAGLSDGRLVPPPSRIWATLVELAAAGELQRHIAVTVGRVAAGFAFGVAAGTLLGAITGYSALTRRLLDPTLQALRAIPSIAWVPLFILWLGIFESSKITLIAVGVFFPVYLGVMGAVLSVDRKIVEVGRVFRLSGTADGAAHPAARRAAGLCDRAALRASGSAGCSWSRPNCSAPRKGSAICWSTASSSASRRRSSPRSWCSR